MPNETGVSRRAIVLLLVLLVLDFGFIALHVLHKTVPAFQAPMFSIEQERGLAEYFQYLKEFLIVVCLACLGRRRRSALYLAWAFLFLFFLLDDSFAIHEGLAEWVRDALGLAVDTPLRNGSGQAQLGDFQGRNYGEMIVYVAYAVVLLAPLVLAHLLSRDAEARRSSRCLLALLVVFAFFAGGADALHGVLVFLKEAYGLVPRVVTGMITLLEDGGEHAAMTVILWFVFSLVERCRDAPGRTLPAGERSGRR